MTGKLQNSAICLLLMGLAVLGCSLTGPAPASPTSPDAAPANPNGGPTTAATESSNTQPQRSDIISADNAKNLVEISTWGKGSGHHPTYSPDGGLLAVSSSSGIYLYDSQTLQQKMYLGQADNLAMAFSGDGKTLTAVANGYDTTVKQWDLASGSELHSWIVDPYNDAYSTNIGALSPDGKSLAISFDYHSSSQDDMTVKLWDVAREQELHGWSVYFPADLAFSPDSKRLAVGAGDGAVTLWNVATGSQVRMLNPGPAGPQDIVSLVFSPDGRRLAVGAATHAYNSDNNTTLWDVGSGREILRFHTPVVHEPIDTAFSLAFAPDGGMLATGSADAIKLWDAAGGKELLSISASNLESLAFSPDGKTLVSAASIGDDSVKLWDAATGNLLNTLKGDDAGNNYIFSADGRTLAYLPTTYGDNTVRLRDVASGGVRILSGHPNSVSSLAFSPDGSILGSGSAGSIQLGADPGKNVLKLWDVASGSELHNLNGHTFAVNSVTFSPDGKMLASGSSDDTVRLWDVASGSEVRTLSSTDIVYGAAFSPDGKLLASGSGDNTIKLWDVASGSEVRNLSGHTMQVISITFSPDGKELISRSYDGNKLWDVASGQELATLSTTWSNTAISPDGKALATGLEDGTIKVLDPATGNELYTLSGDTKLVFGLAFSPDGRLLATGGDNIRVWDAASGQELASFSMNNVHSLAFSPDGELLLAGSSQGMSLWGISP